MSDNQPKGAFNLLKHYGAHAQELNRTIEIRPGAEVEVKYLGKKAWRKLNKRLQRIKGNKQAVDEAAYNATHAELAKAVTGWRGMTPEVVASLMPVDPEGLPEELPHTEQNVLALLLYSSEFFTAVSDAADDLDGFREEADREARGN